MWQRACLFITQLALEGACSKVSLEDVIGEVFWPNIVPSKPLTAQSVITGCMHCRRQLDAQFLHQHISQRLSRYCLSAQPNALAPVHKSETVSSELLFKLEKRITHRLDEVLRPCWMRRTPNCVVPGGAVVWKGEIRVRHKLLFHFNRSFTGS